MLTQKGELTDIGSWYLGGTATGKKPQSSAAALGLAVSKALGWVVALAAVAVIL